MRVTTTIAALLLSAPLACAQPADTLRGPQVEREQLETIVITDMSGNFIPVEGRPELVAFTRICDDPNDLARARELGTARVFELTELLVDEIDTLRQITDANAEGDSAYAQTLMAQIRLKYDPDMVRDPLRADLEEMLNTDQRKRLDSILDEYWLRWVSANTPENAQNMKGEPVDQATYLRIENRLNNQLFQTDIARAYEYSLQRYQGAMTAMYDAIEPTPEQRAWIRNRVIEHIKETRLSPTLEQREALVLEIYEMLDEDRKVKLFLYMARAAMARG
jgi:hypothetical protein